MQMIGIYKRQMFFRLKPPFPHHGSMAVDPI
jgi:hypothetical protein